MGQRKTATGKMRKYFDEMNGNKTAHPALWDAANAGLVGKL